MMSTSSSPSKSVFGGPTSQDNQARATLIGGHTTAKDVTSMMSNFGIDGTSSRGSSHSGRHIVTPSEEEDEDDDDSEPSDEVSEEESDEDDNDDNDDDNDDKDNGVEVSITKDDPILTTHLRLLENRPGEHELNEIKTSPLFTEPVRKYARSMTTNKSTEKPFSQYGLLAGDISSSMIGNDETSSDIRIFHNVAAPSSFFICGSQGSGKSHTLSCLLENCLVKSQANELPNPLAATVFHYDSFSSDDGGSPCEAAWLSSNPHIKVRVLCAPTNVSTIRRLYQRFPKVNVEELRLHQHHLNTKRMHELMAVSSNGGMPLYLHVIDRILRDLRIIQQRNGGGFDYSAFKKMIQAEPLTKDQLAPLKQRLDTLESFMVEDHAKAFDMWAKPGVSATNASSIKMPKKKGAKAKGTNWISKVCPHIS